MLHSIAPETSFIYEWNILTHDSNWNYYVKNPESWLLESIKKIANLGKDLWIITYTDDKQFLIHKGTYIELSNFGYPQSDVWDWISLIAHKLITHFPWLIKNVVEIWSWRWGPSITSALAQAESVIWFDIDKEVIDSAKRLIHKYPQLAKIVTFYSDYTLDVINGIESSDLTIANLFSDTGPQWSNHQKEMLWALIMPNIPQWSVTLIKHTQYSPDLTSKCGKFYSGHKIIWKWTKTIDMPEARMVEYPTRTRPTQTLVTYYLLQK